MGGVHRYYRHRPIIGETISCSVNSIRAEDLEEAVLRHVEDVIFREGYLDGIERRLEFCIRQSGGDTKVSFQHCEAELSKIDKQIKTTIRLLSEMTEEGVEPVLKEALLDLKNKKSETESTRTALFNQLSDFETPAELRSRIELTVKEFRSAVGKASPTMLKRVLHKVFSGIALNNGVARLAYAEGPSVIVTHSTKSKSVAPDLQSGAIPFWAGGKRKLVMVSEHQDSPPLGAANPNLKVKSGFIVRNGVFGANSMITSR